MSKKITIPSTRAPLSSKVLAAARLVANTEIASFNKALAAHFNPSAYQLPSSTTAAEVRYAKLIAATKDRTTLRATLKNAEARMLLATPAVREQRYAGLANVKFDVATPIREQVAPRRVRTLSTATGVRPGIGTLFGGLALQSAPAPAAVARALTSIPKAAPGIRYVVVRLDKLKCIQMTSKAGLELDPDSIDVAGMTIDADGTVERIATLHAGSGYTSAKERTFDHAPILAIHPVREAGPWPQAFMVALALEERDNPSPFTAVATLYENLRDALGSELGDQVEEAVGSVGEDESVNQWVQIIRQVIEWVSREVLPAFDNDVFRPQTFAIHVPEREALTDPTSLSKTLVFNDHGGTYEATITVDWIRAQPNQDNPEIRELQVELRTGGDDLREAGIAEAYLTLQDGRDLKLDLNERQGWPNNSDHQVTWVLPANTHLKDLANFRIRYTSVRRHFLDTGDNWNLDSIKVTYVGPHAVGTLLTASGAPLNRFSENERQEWSRALRHA